MGAEQGILFGVEKCLFLGGSKCTSFMWASEPSPVQRLSRPIIRCFTVKLHWEGIHITLRGGTHYIERGYTLHSEGVHITLRGDTHYTERGYTLHWEGINTTLRGRVYYINRGVGTLYTKRGYSSRWEGAGLNRGILVMWSSTFLWHENACAI